MKIPNSSFSEYFKRSVVFLIKTKLAVFATSIIEFVDLCTNLIDLTYHFSSISLSIFFRLCFRKRDKFIFYAQYSMYNNLYSFIRLVLGLFFIDKKRRFR